MEVYELSEAVLKIPVDIRAEVVAREMIEEGLFSLENTQLIPDGIFKRSFTRDVSGISEDLILNEKDVPAVRINTAREGIADMLPHGIIYQPVINREERTSEIMIRDAETYATEFRNARTFFQPIDIEYGRQRIVLEQFEHESVTNTYAHYGDELYDYLWPDLKLNLTLLQKAALIELTMNVHYLAGDFDICGYYMEKILGQKIQISAGNNGSWITDKHIELANLGNSILGVDWIPFDHYIDYECIKVLVGPVSSEDIIDFRQHQPFGKNYLILEFLCELLLPVELSWSMVLIASEGDFQVNKRQETGVLGYTTILG